MHFWKLATSLDKFYVTLCFPHIQMSWLCIIQSKQCHQFVVGAIVSHLVLTTGMQGNCGSFLRHMVVNRYLPVFGNTAINAAIFSHIQICLLVPTDCQKNWFSVNNIQWKWRKKQFKSHLLTTLSSHTKHKCNSLYPDTCFELQGKI
jgi:hypothetical protein